MNNEEIIALSDYSVDHGYFLSDVYEDYQIVQEEIDELFFSYFITNIMCTIILCFYVFFLIVNMY